MMTVQKSCFARSLVREEVGGETYEYYPLGEYVVAAPGVCGGEPTFRYTRIHVRHILERLHAGEDREQLVAAYHGRISQPAIEEALRLEGERSPQFFERPFAASDSEM